jgi:hypothetical protein
MVPGASVAISGTTLAQAVLASSPLVIISEDGFDHVLSWNRGRTSLRLVRGGNHRTDDRKEPGRC